MSKYTTPLYQVYHWLASIPPKVRWSNKHAVTDTDKQIIAEKLASGYYIILTGHNSYLSSVMISFISWVKTGKWARYSHALMNCDNIESADDRHKFKFVEATAAGVQYATFDEVFACDSVCLLTPNNISNKEWTQIIDALVNQVGEPYDDLFDLADASRKSCVEVVLDALEAADFDYEFANLKDMIDQEGNLVPEMYRLCNDFQVAYEK